MTPARVLLVYPPFGALSFPSIGLSLLKSQLRRSGIDCTIRYLNYDFLDRLPGDFVQRLSAFDAISKRNEYCLGDWIFNGCVFPGPLAEALDDRFRAFVRQQGEGDAFIARCFEVKSLAPSFVQWAAETIPWHEYDIVGFHSIFSQTLAALALAAAAKARCPNVITLFGGPSATGDMGREVLAQFPQIDYVVHGEADETIVSIIRGLVDRTDITAIAGVMHRATPPDTSTSADVAVNPIALVQQLDVLPQPDFEDFFDRFRGRGYERGIDVFLPIENSRGCWWGAKHHCTFCGLNSNSMAFRRKGAAVVYNELVEQSQRYDIRSFACVDSILDMAYFNDLLPRLRDEKLGFRMFYEVKANLSRAQLNLLADAGITLLQPGLEHLSTSVLSLMRKGTTFLQNVQFLKWARERNLMVFWAILYGFPRETFEAYEEIASRIPALYHLFPPKAAVRVRVDRFSPLFTMPEALGLSRVTPARSYRHIYPFEEPTLSRLAYHFEGEYADRDPSLTDRIRTAITDPIAQWNERFFRDGAALDQVIGRERVLVRDTRGGAERYILLDGLASRLVIACDSQTSRQHLETVVATRTDGPAETDASQPSVADQTIDSTLRQAGDMDVPVLRPPEGLAVPDLLGWLVDHAVLIREGERYLNLACTIGDPERLMDRGSGDAANLRAMAATRKVVLEGVA
jgi:ribosomal peptide maturation radical SAM protein 1